MKKFFIAKLSAFCGIAVLICTTSFAAGFTKANEYKEGTFADVPSNAWYASEVKSAYELGFMNGKSDNAFVPDGNVTVAEGITMASRVHSIYNGNTIAEVNGGKWYDMYIAYAKENGIIYDGQFTNFERNIMRYEMAVMFANAMPKDYFTPKNQIKNIPDIAETEAYYDEVLMLYKAGVVMGSDDYGNFYATNPIKRSETAAIINRVALAENRKSGTLKEYGFREEAFYLIDDDDMVGGGSQGNNFLASAWKYENRFKSEKTADASASNILIDSSVEGGTFIHREITTRTRGVVMLETSYTKNQCGSRVIFEDLDGNLLFELTDKTSDGYFYAIGEKEVKIDFSLKSGTVLLYAELDLDSRKAKIVIGGKELGTFDMTKTAKDLSRMSFGTGKEESGNITVNFCHMYTNFALNDTFRLQKADQTPWKWTVEGNVKIEEMACDTDLGIVSMTDAGKASRTFDAVSNKLVYETFVMLDKEQKGYAAIKNGANTVLKIDIADGKFTHEGKLLKTYTPGVWQLIRIEADTENNTALLKINNKACATVPFIAESVDGVEISAAGSGLFRFDDVLVFNTYDYADYCPTPVPVTDDEWIVGMSVCSLWREGTHFGWDCVAPFDEATPLMGYYDEGIPEVADWEIKFMVEHGYDYQHFCWYLGLGEQAPIKQPRLGDAITDGYMNAKYSDMQDFCIMWENASVEKDITDVFYKHVWPYWVDWYFTDDRYLVIDNKPLLSLYNYDHFVAGFGGTEGAKKAISFMKDEIKKLGYDDLIVVFLNDGSNSQKNLNMKEMGASALLSYTFGALGYNPDVQINAMNTAFNKGGITLAPCISVGYNRVAWLGAPRSPFATPEDFKKVLEWAKNDYMPRIAQRETENTWISKMVFANTWNELGEGHYIIPANLHGFGYVDANRAVFSSVAGKDDSKHFDIVPTDNQKARLGYLFPARHNRIKRTYWIQEDQNAADSYEVVKTWKFDNAETCGLWKRAHHVQSLEFDESEKAMHGLSIDNDPSIITTFNEINTFNADEVDAIKVRIKYDEAGRNTMQFFFVNSGTETWTGKKQTSTVPVNANGEYAEYIIDVSGIGNWTGTVTGLRFDPMNAPGNFYIDYIQLLSKKKTEKFVLTVDDVDLTFEEGFFKKTAADVYVAGNPDEGFYNLHNFYYEWNRWNGKLKITTTDDVVFEFTVGSEKAVVNGVEKKLDAAVEVVDGLVMVPVKFIYDNCKIEYTETEKSFDVFVRTAGYMDVIAERVAYSYEFEVPGDLEGWRIGNASGGVSGGNIAVTAVATSKGGYDPQMSVAPNVSAKKYNKIDIRMKPDFANPETAKKKLYIYFGTTGEPNLNEAKKIGFDYTDLTPDKDGYYNIAIDMLQNEKWTDTITLLRLDPGDFEGTYYIDYIRMWGVYDSTAEDTYLEQRESLLAAADEGKAFHVANFDAESTNIPLIAYSTSGTVKIVEDDLNPGNHAYYLKAKEGVEVKSWMYYYMPTRFKPGVTYKVELDVRVMQDQRGNDVNGASLSWNFKYTDTVNGETKPNADHHKPFGKPMSTADGWHHVSFTHTITDTTNDRSTDALAIFANPKTNEDGTISNISYMVDNIVVTVAE